MANARRPYSEIAELVDLSPPAVSDRVTRLQEAGVVRRFTLDIDRSQLQKGIPVLISITDPSEEDSIQSIKETLLDTGAAEHVFTTATAALVVSARVPDTDIAGWLADTLDDVSVESEVILLSDADWSPNLGDTVFALTCVQCGNTVDSEGTAVHIDGDLYQFCCSSCETEFEEKYERVQQQAD